MKIREKVLYILLFVVLASGSYRSALGLGKSEGAGTGTWQAYEVGDVVVFGPAGKNLPECGHSAMLYYQEQDAGSGVWLDSVIDSMPPNQYGPRGVTVNNNVWGPHGPVEKIFTVRSLADGSWSAAKQQARKNLILRAEFYLGRRYNIFDPISTSDIAWTELDALPAVIDQYEQRGPAYPGTFVIQVDSIYASPPGTVDYKPYQAGGNPGVPRFSCCGFTERVYEDEGKDITPAGSTYTHSHIELDGGELQPPVPFDPDIGKAWMFWPKTQMDHGTASVPKPPEVTINTPANDEWHKVNAISMKGYANDVSNMRDDNVHFTATYQADASPTPVDIDFAVNYFAGPGSETTFEDTHDYSDDGYYKVQVDSYDGAGNHADKFKDGTIDFIVKVDTKKPTGSITVSVTP